MRQKELIEKINREMDDLRLREGSSQEEVKKVSRQLRYLKFKLLKYCIISYQTYLQVFLTTFFLQGSEGGPSQCSVQGA